MAVAAGVLLGCLHLGADSSRPQSNPILSLITTNVNRLVNFYGGVLAMKAQRSGDQYAECRTGVGVLTIFSADAQEKYIPGSALPATRVRSLEFKVADVDHEYARLQPFDYDLGQETDNPAMGHTFGILPRSGWQPRKLLYAGEDPVAARKSGPRGMGTAGKIVVPERADGTKFHWPVPGDR
jgi:hypothetical protein